MTSPASRLITLIMLLQRRPNQKAADLAAKLGVSVRTLHRYIAMLDEMGIPIYTERGPQGGFSLVRGYRMPPLVFTPEEAVAVYLGTTLVGEMWGRLYQEATEGALAKLDNVLPDDQRSEAAWARRSLVVTGLHRLDPALLSPLLEQLRRAIREQRQVNLHYQGIASDQVTERLVNPYTLVYRSGWWYLFGWCHLRQALRTFRVDRIRKLDQLSHGFQLPHDFDARLYMEEWVKDQPGVHAILRFVPQAAHLVAGSGVVWERLQVNPDGSVDVTAAAPDLNWLASMVLGFAGLVTVLDPPELRQLVRQWALDTAALYPE